jgi:drug/metabolite transporter (DMT)-like permease
MWLFYVAMYIILSVAFTQLYKISTRTSKNYGSLTILLELVAGISILILTPFFDFSWPSDYRIYIILFIACIFYAIADRLNTTVRSGLEASTFSVIKQIYTVFMILAGFIFFKEELLITKVIGSILIVFSNVIIFYNRKHFKFDKYILLGILANIAYSFALILTINITYFFNLPIFISISLVVPAILIFIFERIKISNIKKAFIDGNKTAIIITGLCWGAMIIAQLRAYQVGEVTSVAPLCAVAVIVNVIVGYIFLKERDNLIRKIIAALIIIVSVFMIKI